MNEIQAIVEKAGHTFDKIEKYAEKSQLLAAVKDADAIIAEAT